MYHKFPCFMLNKISESEFVSTVAYICFSSTECSTSCHVTLLLTDIGGGQVLRTLLGGAQ